MNLLGFVFKTISNNKRDEEELLKLLLLSPPHFHALSLWDGLSLSPGVEHDVVPRNQIFIFQVSAQKGSMAHPGCACRRSEGVVKESRECAGVWLQISCWGQLWEKRALHTASVVVLLLSVGLS